jgi:hypothetical protein
MFICDIGCDIVPHEGTWMLQVRDWGIEEAKQEQMRR